MEINREKLRRLAWICDHCKHPAYEHTDTGICLFSPGTQFQETHVFQRYNSVGDFSHEHTTVFTWLDVRYHC